MQLAASNVGRTAKNATISWIAWNARKDIHLIVFILPASLTAKSTRSSLLMNASVTKRVAETNRACAKFVRWGPSSMKIDARSADRIVKYVIRILCALNAKMIMH